VALGHPDELRARAGGPRVEIIGRGWTDGALQLVRNRPEVAGAHARNGRLVVDLRHAADTAPLVGLLVAAGVQVEEVRRGKASLEEVFLTLMEEESDV
jgi:ABC-2 type transport system ATP-binding protein